MTLASIRRSLARVRAVTSIAVAQLRHTPMQTVFTVLAIALAVLAVTLFASTGLGVLEFGQEGFEQADRDLWIAGGPVELSPDVGIENPIVDAHTTMEELGEHEDVESAAPLAFHAVYVGSDTEDPMLVTAIGLPSVHGEMAFESGEGFSDGQAHYADGTYDGSLTNEIVIDRQTATALDVTLGDTISVSSNPDADKQEMTVVGISSEYSTFLGTSTVAVPLAELQRLVGTTEADRASMISIQLVEGADPTEVRDDLQAEYPEYDVRTDREQFTTMLESQAVLFVSAAAIVVLGVLVGIGLTINVLAMSVLQRMPALRALQALGTPRSLLAGMVVVRGGLLAAAGGTLGLVLTPFAVRGVNLAVEGIIGVSELLVVTMTVVAVGFAVAIVVGTIGSIAVGWSLAAKLAESERIE